MTAGLPSTIWEIYREFPPTVIEALTPRTMTTTTMPREPVVVDHGSVSLSLVDSDRRPWLQGTLDPPPPLVLKENVWGKWFSGGKCPSCHPTNSIRTPKETQRTRRNHGRSTTGLIWSSLTTRLLKELGDAPFTPSDAIQYRDDNHDRPSR